MLLRLFLFSGLLFHKIIWEIWKRKFTSVVHTKSANLAKRILKLGKICFLLFLLVQALFLDLFPIRNASRIVMYSGLLLFSLGLCMSVVARIGLGHNWTDVEDQQVMPNQTLVTRGIYRYVRHPIYAGDVLLVVGFELALQSWLFLLGLPIALVVVRQARREERLLTEAFPEYREYCSQTKRFIPFVV